MYGSKRILRISDNLKRNRCVPLDIIFSPPKSRLERFVKGTLLDLIPAAAAAVIIAVFRIDPAFTEKVFSQGIFPVASRIIGILGRLLPFSLIAVISALIPIIILIFFFGFLKALIKKRYLTAEKYFHFAVRTASLIFLIFALTCAPNYARMTFAELSGLEVRGSDASELFSLCEELLSRASDARNEVSEDENGVFTLERDFSESSDLALLQFHELGEEYPFLLKVYDGPKKMIFSEILSYMEVTGFYSCFTNEANINTHMPDLEKPFTMCHELAHSSGFMREDEANFIGYLATSRSDDPASRYSGLICALNLSMNELYKAFPEGYWAIRSSYPDNINRDLAYSGDYWSKYEGTKSAQVYDTVNDAYLKANGQKHGTGSYGRMVDLLLAEYRLK